ncbi:hypothetical protein [Kitasatospora sp. GP82]|uniref:hypothetical protein n=1 Tax=Kitasatospora sp. GP82 TaxID=3035089 RepID=UPI002472F6CF|nr:hypothetical protein [Kitasatospora sp. GP82]MDH6129382.1 hypothetical protein [Kitasatospora sp. GP82]
MPSHEIRISHPDRSDVRIGPVNDRWSWPPRAGWALGLYLGLHLVIADLATTTLRHLC